MSSQAEDMSVRTLVAAFGGCQSYNVDLLFGVFVGPPCFFLKLLYCLIGARLGALLHLGPAGLGRTCGDLAEGDAELQGFSLDHYKDGSILPEFRSFGRPILGSL